MATNNWKRPASESDDDTSSDEEPKKRHPQKKTKHGSYEADEEVEESDGVVNESPERVEEDDEEPVDEVGEKVSYWAAVHEVKLTWLVKEACNLEDRHHGEIPEALIVKKDTTKDLPTIFSDRITVNFRKAGTTKALKGRWCLTCR